MSPTTGGSSGSGSCNAAVLYDFESCPDGFSASPANAMAAAPSWACGDPTSGPGAAVTGVWATNLSGNYNTGESSALDSPSISLVGCEGMAVNLHVTHWYDIEAGRWDGGNFSISTDGGNNWTVVEACGHPYDHTGLSTTYVPPDNQPGFTDHDQTWRTSTIDLTPYLGQPDVRLRLVFGSDSSNEETGWYIDTVEVTVQ